MGAVADARLSSAGRRDDVREAIEMQPQEAELHELVDERDWRGR